jgi:nucleoside-diphosphate-sugar epimerase
MESYSGRHLVIFGCGYVGSALARWGSSVGLAVRALTRNRSAALLLREAGVETVVADLASNAWHEEMSETPEFAVNCVSSGGGGVEGYRHSYAEGMASIAEWARARRAIGTLLYTSSTSVYPQDGGTIVDESMPTPPANERAEVLAETEARVRAADAPWHRWFILRLAGIYGPGRHQLLDQVRMGEVAGTEGHHLNLIHRDDIVSAIGACLFAPGSIRNEIFNVADDGHARRSEIVAWLARELLLPQPRFSGQPAEGRRAMTADRVIANGKLKRMLGWQPRFSTFREGYASLLSR